MPRATLTKTTALGPYGTYSAGLADVTMTAANVADKNQFVSSGRDLVVARNSDAVNPYTVTINSIADPTYGRTGDITTYSLAAGDIAVFGPFPAPGWKQADGYVYLEGSNVAVLFGVIALPSV